MRILQLLAWLQNQASVRKLCNDGFDAMNLDWQKYKEKYLAEKMKKKLPKSSYKMKIKKGICL